MCVDIGLELALFVYLCFIFDYFGLVHEFQVKEVRSDVFFFSRPPAPVWFWFASESFFWGFSWFLMVGGPVETMVSLKCRCFLR